MTRRDEILQMQREAAAGRGLCLVIVASGLGLLALVVGGVV